MPTNFEQLIFEIIATDRNASAAFDRFRQKVDQTSKSVDTNTSSLDKNTKKIDDAGKSADKATGLFSALGGTGNLAGGGMGAAIAAGVALSPVLVTVGTGLGGLALAAYGAIKPIETAAQKTGGLRANMASLNPEQQKLAISTLGLQKQYGAFEKALQPQVLSVFGKGIELAGHLMRDVQPVAQQTGKAIGGFLDRIDAEFQSGTWKSFFSWMSAQVGPDIQLIGTSVVDLVNALPPLLQSLQPVALQLLQFVDDGAKLIDIASRVNLRVQQLGHTADTSGGFLGRFAHAAQQAFNELAPGVQGSQQLEHWLGKLGTTTNTAAAAQAALNKRVAASHAATADLLHPVNALTGGLQSAKTVTQNETMAVLGLTNALKGMGSGLLTTQQDQITWRQAQIAATQAIKANTGSLDSNKSSALAARAAIIASTQSALAFANQEVNVHHDTDAASRILQAQIRYLQDHAGKSKVAAAEVGALRAALQKLQGIGPVRESIFMTGKGTWGIFGKNPVNSGLFNPAATGARVPGYGGGDRHLYLLEGGEAVVPKETTAAHAKELRAWGIPGMAVGGVAGSYAGNVPGLQSWTVHNWNASLLGISNAMAAAIQRAVAGALSAIPSGVGGNTGAWIAQSLAINRLPGWWGPLMAILVGKESGGNPRAYNPISVLGQHAEGIAQMLPSTFAAYTRGGSIWNPVANLVSSERYIEAVYGNPRNIAGLLGGTYYGYDSGGWLPPGVSLAVNRTGAPERVLPPGGGGNTYNITVNVPVSANKAETGRAVVEAIRMFEQRSGAGWRS